MNTDFTLGHCLFGAVELTKNADPDKYGYNGYSNEFDARSQFLLSNGEWGKNVVILAWTIVYHRIMIIEEKRYHNPW